MKSYFIIPDSEFRLQMSLLSASPVWYIQTHLASALCMSSTDANLIPYLKYSCYSHACKTAIPCIFIFIKLVFIHVSCGKKRVKVLLIGFSYMSTYFQCNKCVLCS